jgi:hypothetical protein
LWKTEESFSNRKNALTADKQLYYHKYAVRVTFHIASKKEGVRDQWQKEIPLRQFLPRLPGRASPLASE